MVESEPQFGQPHPQAFTVHIGQGVLAVGPKPLGDVVLVPNKAMQFTGQGDGVFVMGALIKRPAQRWTFPAKVGELSNA